MVRLSFGCANAGVTLNTTAKIDNNRRIETPLFALHAELRDSAACRSEPQGVACPMPSHLPLAFGRVAESWIDFDPSGQRAAAGRAAVATANPLASWAAIRALNAGGTAVDAAIAAQAMLTLVEPNASGIGGGAMIMLHTRGSTWAYDGLSAAPAAAPERIAAEIGGMTVGVPGALAALDLAHRAHGALPWTALFADAIELAEEGFALSPYLHRTLADMKPMWCEPQAALLYAGLPAGTQIRNPGLAATLRAIALDGARSFYEGETAYRIATEVNRAGGILTAADLAGYQALRRAPVSFALGEMTVHGGPLPCYGAISAGQIVGIAAALGLTGLGVLPDLEAVHILATAGSLARADRAPYQDPAAGTVDVVHMLDPSYLAGRAKLFDPAHLPASHPAGPERGGSMTSHLSIADGRGQMLAMTTTINQNFGAQLSVGGFYLNNVMTNFAANPKPGTPNAMAPGLRARTTIGPSIVLDSSGNPVAALGAGGGYRIIGYVANALLRIAGGMKDPAAILRAPHAMNWDGTTEIEPPLAHLREALDARGHSVQVRRLDGATQLVLADGGVMRAFGDLRRDGAGMALV